MSNEDFTTFERELTELINRHCIDNTLGCHDFVIAKYLAACLGSLMQVKDDEKYLSDIGYGNLKREQPCGCVVCICEDDEQCQGCGAKHCGNHPIGEIPNPEFID